MAVTQNDLVAFEYNGEPVNARIFLIEDLPSLRAPVMKRMIIHIQDLPQYDQPYTEVTYEIPADELENLGVKELSRRLSEKFSGTSDNAKSAYQ